MHWPIARSFASRVRGSEGHSGPQEHRTRCAKKFPINQIASEFSLKFLFQWTRKMR